jgi:hypothetical protein
MTQINSLIFENLDVDNDFRWLLKKRFTEDDVYDLFDSEVNIVSRETDMKEKTSLPAVTLSVYQAASIQPDDEQLQAYTPFTLEVNVYTSGRGRVDKCIKLCNIIIKILQSNGTLPHYYCRGLTLESNNEVGTFLNNAYRRVIRMSGLCYNNQKIIINRR